jgi:fructose-bisphosphate aldolase class I
MSSEALRTNAKKLVADGKGILAIDETPGTLSKRFAKVKIPFTEETRRSYRAMLCTTPGLEQYIGGVIFFDETVRQQLDSGSSFVSHLKSKGILPGIKVDARTWPLAGCPGEVVTEGLDGLRTRLESYRKLGVDFCKWRAVIKIGPGLPTPRCISANAHALARYAALCQENELVPIVEPEVLMDGDHDIARCEQVTSSVLQAVFSELWFFGVALDSMVLKPNMVTAGREGPESSPDEVAVSTLRCLRGCVPAAVPGIAFLSGGQGPDQATANLNAINKTASGAPWRLSFSFGRALQDEALNAWQGDPQNAPRAQELFLKRARACSLASLGKL